MNKSKVYKHEYHRIDIEFHPLHPAKIICSDCGTYIKWASYRELQLFDSTEDKRKLLSSWKNFQYELHKEAIEFEHQSYYERHVLPTEGEHNIYLNVNYNEKDEVKKLGAKWDAVSKKWFIKSNWTQKKQSKFAKWIT